MRLMGCVMSDDYQWDVANWEAQERFCKRSWAGLDGFVDQVIVNQ